jgi:tyrosyl-tRNA synthetase
VEYTIERAGPPANVIQCSQAGIALVHGDAAVREAEAISAALFSGEVAALNERQLDQAVRGLPTTELTSAELQSLSMPDVLVRSGLADSRRAARELLSGGAVQINGHRADALTAAISGDAALFSRYVVLRKGKKTYHVLIVR